MKKTLLKILIGLISIWPLAIIIWLGYDALSLYQQGIENTEWLVRKQFFPLVFPVLMTLLTFVPMMLSDLNRQLPKKRYQGWLVFVILLAPLAMPVYWYQFIWKVPDLH